jgi:hypothetical protein
MDISRDDAVFLANDQRWRDAMRRLGRVAVETALSRRPGHPGELLDDIVYEPPYPTRAFCQQWCAEQDNILLRFSPTMGVILVLLVAVTACLVEAFSGSGIAPPATLRAGAPAGGMQGAVSGRPAMGGRSLGTAAPPSTSQSSRAAQWPGLGIPTQGTPGGRGSGAGTSP